MVCALSTRLVHTLKYEVLIVVLELLSYLSPDSHKSGLDIVISCSKIRSVDPALLMVNVEDNVHIVLISIVYYLVNTSEPCGIDLVVAVKMLEPCCRDTDCVEALCLEGIEESLISLRVFPAGLSLNTAACERISVGILSISVEGVTEVPAHLHILCDLECCESACSVY